MPNASSKLTVSSKYCDTVPLIYYGAYVFISCVVKTQACKAPGLKCASILYVFAQSVNTVGFQELSIKMDRDLWTVTLASAFRHPYSESCTGPKNAGRPVEYKTGSDVASLGHFTTGLIKYRKVRISSF